MSATLTGNREILEMFEEGWCKHPSLLYLLQNQITYSGHQVVAPTVREDWVLGDISQKYSFGLCIIDPFTDITP